MDFFFEETITLKEIDVIKIKNYILYTSSVFFNMVPYRSS